MGGLENVNSTNQSTENINLKLNGSQINLSSRPQTKNVRTNPNTPLISPHIFKRPRSAMPDLPAYKHTDLNKTTAWMRPQSADNAVISKLHKSKLTSRSPLNLNLNCNNIQYNSMNYLQDMQSPNKNKNLLLPSSKLLETLLSEPVMRSWAHPHVQSSTSSTADELSEEIESYKSDDPSDSEISLGTKIQMVAQKNQAASMQLIPGIKHKPPLPFKKPADQKIEGKPSPIKEHKDVVSEFRSRDTDFDHIQPSPNNVLSTKVENYSNSHLVNLLLGIESKKDNLESTNNVVHYESVEDTKLIDELNVDTKSDPSDNKIQIKNEGPSFQRWLKENIAQAASNNIDLTEQTDIILESLKKQQEEFSGCLLKVESNQKLYRNEDWSLECLIEEPECLIEESEGLIDDDENRTNNVLLITEPETNTNGKIINNETLSEIGEKPDLDNTVQKFSLEEYDAKLKRDSEFLSLDIPNNLDNPENNFISLNNEIKPDKMNLNGVKFENSIKLDFEMKNKIVPDKSENKSPTLKLKDSLSTDNKSPTSKSKTKDLSNTENKSKSILKTHLKRNPSPELKTCEEVVSWMSFKDNSASSEFVINTEDDIETKKVMKKETYCGNISEKPERDESVKSKSKTKVLQNVISTIPSTYNDIVSILHVLEEENTSRENYPVDPIKDEQKVSSGREYVRPIENLQKSTQFNSKSDTNIDLNSSSTFNMSNISNNYTDLLSYLDEVDRNSTQTLNNAVRFRSDIVKEPNLHQTMIPNLENLIALGSVELAHQVLGMHLQLEEKTSSIKLLQDALSDRKNTNQKLIKQIEIENRKKLKLQKDEHEAVIKRHQKFIDQLIADKKTLSDRCEKLVKEIHNVEERHASAMKAAEHRHVVELQRAKDMHAAGERLRRERWIDTKTQKIKELTVKSIEPELQSMQNRQQQEISDLRIMHKREIEELELRAARKTQQHCETLREQLTAEKEEAIAKERDLMRQRLEKLSESEEKSYQEQRMRLMSEIAREKKRMEEELSGRISDCVAREQTAQKEKEREIHAIRTEFNDHLKVITKRHENELRSLKENLEIEKESWKSNYKKQQTLELSEKEAVLREQCRRDRDREIELVIERLENEACETKKQTEQLAENKIKRLMEKYDGEIKELEASEESIKKKYNEMKNKLVFTEESLIALQMSNKRLDAQCKEMQELNDKLMTERNKMRDMIREELKGEVTALERQVQSLKDDRNREIQQIYTRVRVAVARKDEALNTLTNELKTLQERCIHLEDLLQQQRKEYLIK